MAGGSDQGDALRRYLQTRRSLEDPELVLPGRTRRETIELVRKAVRALESDAARFRAESDSDRSPAEAPEAPAATESGQTGTEMSRTSNDDGLPTEPPPLEGAPSLEDAEIDRLAREASGEEIRDLPDLATLQRVASGCLRCPLHETRESVVFGEGNPDARVVCVGEAPGATEDRTGRPFVGPAGQLLDRLLMSAGFHREDVFICNVLKCRPPGNRNPRSEEIEQCSPYLHRQLQLLQPEVIVAFGTFASQTLLEARDSLGRLRRQTHLYRGWPLVVTYHPAALLRNPKWTVPAWEDIQKVRRLLEDDAPGDRPADSERMQVEVFDSDE